MGAGPGPGVAVRRLAEQPYVAAHGDHVVPPAAGLARDVHHRALGGWLVRARPQQQVAATARAAGPDHDRLAERGTDAERVPGAPAPPHAVPRVAGRAGAVATDQEAHRGGRERV